MKKNYIKSILQEYIDEFIGCEITQKFHFHSKKRAEFARKIDEDFYKKSIETIKTLCKYVILLNTNKLSHLYMYENEILQLAKAQSKKKKTSIESSIKLINELDSIITKLKKNGNKN